MRKIGNTAKLIRSGKKKPFKQWIVQSEKQFQVTLIVPSLSFSYSCAWMNSNNHLTIKSLWTSRLALQALIVVLLLQVKKETLLKMGGVKETKQDLTFVILKMGGVYEDKILFC